MIMAVIALNSVKTLASFPAGTPDERHRRSEIDL
jgi:hypothetical protein